MKRSTIALWLTIAFALTAVPEALGAPGQDRVPNEVVILDPHGINPAAITRAQGEFVLFILNRLPDKDETFTLAPLNPSPGASIPAVQPASTDSLHDHTGRDLTLPPGTYHLQLKNHPKMSVLITITP